MMIVTSNLIQTPKVVTIDQNRWSRSVKFTGHDLLEWVVTVDQNTQVSALTFAPALKPRRVPDEELGGLVYRFAVADLSEHAFFCKLCIFGSPPAWTDCSPVVSVA